MLWAVPGPGSNRTLFGLGIVALEPYPCELRRLLSDPGPSGTLRAQDARERHREWQVESQIEVQKKSQ